jgi:hypothetical protein
VKLQKVNRENQKLKMGEIDLKPLGNIQHSYYYIFTVINNFFVICNVLSTFYNNQILFLQQTCLLFFKAHSRNKPVIFVVVLAGFYNPAHGIES